MEINSDQLMVLLALVLKITVSLICMPLEFYSCQRTSAAVARGNYKTTIKRSYIKQTNKSDLILLGVEAADVIEPSSVAYLWAPI